MGIQLTILSWLLWYSMEHWFDSYSI